MLPIYLLLLFGKKKKSLETSGKRSKLQSLEKTEKCSLSEAPLRPAQHGVRSTATAGPTEGGSPISRSSFKVNSVSPQGSESQMGEAPHHLQ